MSLSFNLWVYSKTKVTL